MIDIEKFICSLIEKTGGFNTHVYHCDLLNALKAQGLEYKNGEIIKTQRRIAAEAKEALYTAEVDSDDERIRKILIEFVKGYSAFINGQWHLGNFTTNELIAWLEKQGNEKKDIRIERGKNYICTKTHKYGGAEWVEGTKYYACENYFLNNQGCAYYCPDYSKEEHNELFKEVEYDYCIEKQDDSADNVKSKFKDKPKFKVGDFILNGDVTDYGKPEIFKIQNICSDWYNVENIYDGRKTMITFKQEWSCRLWDIIDAKDGDVLVDKYNNIGIFKECKDIYWLSHIYLGCDNELRGFNVGSYHEQADTYPATKEQCDLLFSKMKEEGYDWDNKKKELKKIEQKSSDSYCKEHCKGYQETGKCFADGDCDAKREADNKQWSEEDKIFVHGLIRGLTTKRDIHGHTTFSSDYINITETIHWLELLKQRLGG